MAPDAPRCPDAPRKNHVVGRGELLFRNAFRVIVTGGAGHSGFIFFDDGFPERCPFGLEAILVDAEPTHNRKRGKHHRYALVVGSETRNQNATNHVAPHVEV